jgi:hypothetical protein
LFNAIKDLDLAVAVDVTSRKSLSLLEECFHLKDEGVQNGDYER